MRKKAILIIHGIGSQRPQSTLKDFVKNYADLNSTIYSNPDRISNSYETRRMLIDGIDIDFFEYYWANLMEYPSGLEIFKWVIGLFWKKPSKRVKVLKIKILAFILFIVSLIFYVWFKIKCFQILPAIALTLLSLIVLYFIFAFLMKLFSVSIAETIGDAVKYLTPSPINISTRYNIRKNGIDFLKKLHEAKEIDGSQKYNEIIVVGHSLGAVVAYDIINNLWIDYMYDFKPKTQKINHEPVEVMRDFIENGEINPGKYNQLQKGVLDYIQDLNNPWKITNFITVGSPLAHGHFLLSENENDFEEKVKFREFPCCPPKLEVDKDKAFYFNQNFNITENGPIAGIKVINHSSQYSFIKWTNMYFENDYIGGSIKAFGEGINNLAFKAKGSFLKKNLWFGSHSSYWERDQESYEEIKKIIKN